MCSHLLLVFLAVMNLVATSDTTTTEHRNVKPSESMCRNFPTAHIGKWNQVKDYLSEDLAKEVSAKAFKNFPSATLNAVYLKKAASKWRKSQFQTCSIEVFTLYEVLKFHLTPILIGHDCRIHFDQLNQEYVEELTVCRNHTTFLYTHHCPDCASFEDIQQWARDHFLPGYNSYVVIGPISYFSFYGYHHASHSTTLVAFVADDNVYVYKNARLVYDGYSGHIYKLDLSENDLYNQGHNRGLFEPNYPPGFENVTPYVTPDLQYNFYTKSLQ